MNAARSEPFDRFQEIFKRAEKAQTKDPNQMWLATVDQRGRRQVRVVLLKGFDQSGFVFFTNYEVKRLSDLQGTPFAALNFYWPCSRRIRVEWR